MMWLFQAHWRKIAFIAMSILVLAFALSFLVPPPSLHAPTSVFDSSWKGHSQMFAQISKARTARVVFDLGTLKGNEVLIIAAPNANLSSTAAISHLRTGGSLLLVDASAYSDETLRSLSVSRSPGPIVDKQNYFAREDAPLYAFRGGFVASRRSYALSCASNCSFLLKSSGDSWVDTDRNGMLNMTDSQGSFTSAVSLGYNSTSPNIIIVSDRSVFSNEMLLEGKNSEFLAEAVRILDPKSQKVFAFYDGDKSSMGPISQAALEIVRAVSSPVSMAGLFMVVALLAYLASRESRPQEASWPTHYGRLKNGIGENIGKNKEPYVWLAEKLTSMLKEEIENSKKRQNMQNVDIAAFQQALAVLSELEGLQFKGMDVISLEARIDKASKAIVGLRKVSGGGLDGRSRIKGNV